MKRYPVDELSGAYRREALAGALEEAAARQARTGEPYAVAMLDVDHLKTLNDVYGHATGDAVIKAVAERAREVLRDRDDLFRYGGDEFLVLLAGSSLSEAERALRRVRDRVTANPVEGRVWVHVQVSAGVAASDETEPGGRGRTSADPAALFERADARLYVAKRSGRNTVVASDEHVAPTHQDDVRETRIFGRDEQLKAFDAHLARRAATVQERTLRLVGPAGVGFGRYLSEVGTRGALAGQDVRRVTLTPADSGVHLRALELAYGAELGPDATERSGRRLLANSADGHGLLLLLEGGRWLDTGSRELLAERLERGGLKVVEVVPFGGVGAFPAAGRVELSPLSRTEVSTWVSAVLGRPVDATTARALTDVSGGLPSKIAAIVKQLLRQRRLDLQAQTVSVAPELIEELAQLDRPAPVSSHVPRYDTPLIGRSSWLRAFGPMVAQARLTTLIGEGGVGKSRLAAQLAAELADRHGGTVVWVDLRAVRTGAEARSALAEAAGLGPVDDVNELAEGLQGRTLLMVLDEADGVADDIGWLAVLLTLAHSLRVIATSRAPLRLGGEEVVEVPSLSDTAAAEMFRQGMKRVSAPASSQDEPFDHLLAHVGTTPLAVELAAAWTRALSPAELAKELEASPGFLAETPDMGERVTRFIDVTRELMSQAERGALGTLALVPAGFTADLAKRTVQASPFFLLALLERSLIRREGDRYSVHAAVAERYASGLPHRDDALRKIVRALSGRARELNQIRGSDRTTVGYRQVDPERRNFAFALRTAVSLGDDEATWPLVRLLRGYLDVRGRSREGVDLFGSLEQELRKRPFTELTGWVNDALGLFESQRGNRAEAEARLVWAISRLEELEPGETLTMAWNTLGVIRGNSGDLEGALVAFETSADYRAELGDTLGVAQARGNLAILLGELGRPREAQDALEEALASYRGLGHVSGVALTLLSLAELGEAEGLMSEDRRTELARQALEEAESIAYAMCARRAATVLGTLLSAAGERRAALSALRTAREWAEVEENDGVLAEIDALLEGALGFAQG